MKLKLSIIILFFLVLFQNTLSAKIELKIIYKINNEIITNIDLQNEALFLLFLNPKLNNLSEEKIKNISKNSLINRKIKEIELSKYFDLKENNSDDFFIKSFISNTNLSSIEDLKNELSKNNLNYYFFEQNLKIDNLWRKFIFNKFKSQININVDDLKQQLLQRDNEIEELDLSELLFNINADEIFEDKKNIIYSEIEKSGFEAAASIYSISESKDFGGKLGWIKSNQISKNIYSMIKKTKLLTEPIKTNNGYLILKINQKRTVKKVVNFEEELKKLINKETESELNKLGYIYFNKVKKRIFISEN